ncbi:apolipoprotein N-acyltransferase [Planktothrix agardhii CCAP 1459/11A]|jgi:apolipoprotein N-acyltransferase|uniref:Apolipoprotein N-acyltransferase n=2 Tax=Planktothrix TaxID=54304 RepID=A0A479ZSK5_PLAAG|nr:MULTISPECIES: apolipoprotein N-acyltransferase [Planktothrix]CAD5911016.1 Apolipoprotein N-acyltransferase [Planktothrix rubescens]MCB8761058.1 apolipoprotein N-acyltransferase [Planktothrix agardhii 1813]CAC5345632.1 Apolipoprotein N-acyltransferase [Planktothrix rubescens NIVA-CYA 18]CAD5955988.1 Apolipoprotein N-acyltransferase [Planktothrix rubescens NIVA-CYA 18]CAH2573371.1 Apolipoprotein N-acyltransferase [Planktothrix rubescens]
MNKRELIQPLLLTGIAGVLMGVAAEPWGLWGLAWVALVPLWVNVLSNFTPPNPPLLSGGSFARFKITLILALVWGIGYYGTALFWITGIHPMTWLGVPWLASLAITIFCWSFLTLWGTALVIIWTGLFVILSAQLAQRFSKIYLGLSRVLIATILWCGLEFLWSSTALWWSSLSYTQSFGNLIILHLGQISGPTTITATLLIVNGLIAEGLILNRDQSYSQTQDQNSYLLLILAVLFLIFAHGLGLILYSIPLQKNPDQALKVGIIQGNIANEVKLNYSGFLQALNGYTTGYITLANQGVDFVVTPETALPFFWTDSNQRQNSSFYQAVLKQKVPAIVGSFALKENGYTNSLFSMDGEGNIIGQYDKANLVPLGEFIPFSEILGKFISRLSPLEATLIHGKPNQQFQTAFGQATVGICYDSAFAEHFRRQTAQGGEFLITASNDAYYSYTILAQHHALDVMRAIENHRWTIRATNTGYSGFIDPHGRTQWISNQNIYQLYADTIYRDQTQTLYVRWGDWLMPVLLIAGATLFLFKIDRYG